MFSVHTRPSHLCLSCWVLLSARGAASKRSDSENIIRVYDTCVRSICARHCPQYRVITGWVGGSVYYAGARDIWGSSLDDVGYVLACVVHLNLNFLFLA